MASKSFFMKIFELTQPAFTCSKLTIKTLEQGVDVILVSVVNFEQLLNFVKFHTLF